MDAPVKKSGPIRQDGIRTLADIQLRCRPNHTTGCLMWAGAAKGQAARVWVPEIGICSMVMALQWVQFGTKPTADRMLVPMCGNAACANVKHRQWGTRSQMAHIIKPRATVQARAKLSAIRRAKSRLNEALVAEIRASNETCAELGRRYGVDSGHIGQIRMGKEWASTTTVASSVFAWAGAR
jgi:hypothetical protein